MKNLYRFLKAASSVLALTSSTVNAYELNKITEINVQKPAFLFNYVNNSTGEFDLYISSFGPFRSGSVQTVNNINSQILSNEFTVSTAIDSLKWPNEITQVPAEIFGENVFAVADGFLVPGKATGSITVFNKERNVNFKLTKDKGGFFYHRVVWHDVNGDGLLDAITARAKKPMIGRSRGELVWLEQPVNNKASTWKEHFITEGPDVHFRISDLDGNGEIEIISTEFFGKKLSITEQKGNAWERTIIDSNLGSAFDLALEDVNNDGKKDLLVTNHEGDSNASVFVYEVPANIHDKWTRHTIHSGFVTRQKGMGQASPGEAMAVHPSKDSLNSKPVILVSGDGSQHAHILIPISEDPNNWEYKADTFLNAGCTVGKMAVTDVNSDGYLEVFVPAYDKDTVHVFSFSK